MINVKRKIELTFLFLALSLMIVIPTSAGKNTPMTTVISTVKDRIVTMETRATDGATHGYGNVERGGTHSWSEDTWFEDAAHAHVGYYLAYWEYDGVELPNTENITVLVTQGTHTLVAVFSPEPTDPPPSPPPPEPIKYALVISRFSCDGSALPIDCVTNPIVGSYLYEEGQTASVTATAGSEWFFSNWVLDDANMTENPIIIAMSGNHSLVAVFNPIVISPLPPPPPLPEPVNYTLMISAISCDGSPLPSDCITDPVVGAYLYQEGQVVTTTATASEGWSFSYWLLDDLNGTENPTNIEMISDHALVAVFNPIPVPPPPPPPPEHTITVIEQSCNYVSGGFGYVSPNGTSTYYSDVLCNHTAYPAEGWFLQSWNYDGQEYSPDNDYFEILVTEGTHTLTATFNPIPTSPPPPLPESENLTVIVGFCGDTMDYRKTIVYYEGEAPTTVTLKISSTAYAEILKYFGTTTFTGPYRETAYSQHYYTETQYYMAEHSLAIAVIGVPSIQVTLVP